MIHELTDRFAARSLRTKYWVGDHPLSDWADLEARARYHLTRVRPRTPVGAGGSVAFRAVQGSKDAMLPVHVL